ncbi:hypothetical protein BGK70_01480 [Streptomyces agglomeratus]|nr:hypothetical protein BGK70_01480 [Streptomyces agglomeratus]
MPVWSFSLRMEGYDIGWCLRRALAQIVALASEDGVGECELSDLVPERRDFGLLCGNGFLQVGHRLTEPLFRFRGLLRLNADAFVELVLQVRMALLEGHAVNTGLGRESDDGQCAVGGCRPAGEEPVDGSANTCALVSGLLGHVRASAG